MLDQLIRELGGRWSRPFVTEGDPLAVEIAIVGLNPATPITPAECPLETYSQLLTNRSAFEALYRRLRVAKGKSSISPTRKRLSQLVEGYAQFRVAETNSNAFPTKDSAELRRSPVRSIGAQIATDYLSSLRPLMVIVHGDEAKQSLVGRRILECGPSSLSSGAFHQFGDAKWMDRPTRCLLIPHLVSRGKGWDGPEIAQIIARCRPQ